MIIAGDIYGPNTNSLKDKTMCRTVGHVREDATTDVPRYIMDRYRDITLSEDIMHVNGVPFFVAISRHIKHIAIVPMKKKNQAIMLTSIDKIKAAYKLRGFKIKNTGSI